jgi:hypothetical protein
MRYEIIKDLPRLGFIYKQVEDLTNYYPNFKEWYFNKFIASVYSDTGLALGLFKKKRRTIRICIIKK